MRRTGKQLLSVLLALAMCLNLFPGTVYAAEPEGTLQESIQALPAPENAELNDSTERVFISQPNAEIPIEIDPINLVYRVEWSTNFTPKKIEIHSWDSEHHEILPHAELEGNGNGSFDLPASSAVNRKYVIWAYYEEDGTLKYIKSNEFSLSHDNLVFALQPSVTVDQTSLSWTVNWTTNFVPTKVEVIRKTSSGNILYRTIEDMGNNWSGSTVFEFSTPHNDPFTLRAYFSGSNYVESAEFNLEMPEPAFLMQPDRIVYLNVNEGNYKVSWKTNFIPTKIGLLRDDDEWQVSPEQQYGYEMSITIGGTSSTDSTYKIRAYNEDYEPVDSEPFTLNNEAYVFLNQPGPTVDISTEAPLQYVVRWKTSFVPTKIQIFRRDGTGALDPDTCVKEIRENLLDNMLAVLEASMLYTDLSFYVRAFYTDTLYKDSDYFHLSHDNLAFEQQPENQIYDPDTLSTSVSWETNFEPVKVEMVLNETGEDWQNHVVLYTIDNPSYSNEFSLNNPTTDSHNYYLRAYYNSDSYVISDYFTVSLEWIKFTVQPTILRDPETGLYTARWETSFTPKKIHIHYDDDKVNGEARRGTLVAELTEDLQKVGSYTFEAEPGTEHDYFIEAYYNSTYDISSDLFNRARFTTVPENGYAIAYGTDTSSGQCRLTWATNAPTSLVEVWTYNDQGSPVKNSELPANTTEYYINYMRAASSPTMRWFFRAYFSDTEYCDTPDVLVMPMLIPNSDTLGFNIKSYPYSHVVPVPEDADYPSAFVYNSNFNDTAAYHYDFTFSAKTHFTLELEVTNKQSSGNEDANDRLYLSYSRYVNSEGTLQLIGLPESILNILPDSGGENPVYGLELNTTILALHEYFEQTSNPEPDVFDIKLYVNCDGKYYSFYLKDIHVPIEDYDPWEIYGEENDGITLSEKAFAPRLTFDDAAPELASVRADWYVVLGTEFYADEEHPNIYNAPFQPIPMNPFSEEEAGYPWDAYGQPNWEIEESGVRDTLAYRFSRYFGDGYNSFVTGPANTAPRGPANFLFGIAANKLSLSGEGFDSVAVSLSDFADSQNVDYFNSLIGLAPWWLGYYLEEEDKPDYMPDYRFSSMISCELTVTFADGVTYSEEITYTAGIEDTRFHVTGETVTVEPSFKTHNLVLSGQIGVNFFMDLGMLSEEEREASYVEFQIGNDSQITRVDFDPAVMNSKGTFYGFTCYINVMQMADDIHAVFHGQKDGVDISVDDHYSAEMYINQFAGRASEFSQATQNLVRAIADYGYYAQHYLADLHQLTFGDKYAEMTTYYTDSYDYAVVKANVQNYALTYNIEGTGITKVTHTLSLESETILDIFFAVEPGVALNATAVFNGNNYDAVLQDDGRYRIRINEIAAHRLGGADYNVSITGNANGAFTASAWALSYVNATLDSDLGDNAKNAMCSLYRYYEAAAAYKAASAH